MELYKEIITNILANEEVQVIFPNLNIDGNKIVELKSYKALQKIKTI